MFTVAIVLCTIISIIPTSALASNEIDISGKTVLSTNVNSLATQRIAQLLTKKILSNSDIDSIEQYAEVCTENIDENLSFITISPYAPEKIITYDDGTVVETYTKIGYIMATRSSGLVEEDYSNSILWVTMRLTYDKIYANNGDPAIKLKYGYTTITNKDNQCTLTRLNMYIREQGWVVVGGEDFTSYDFSSSRNIYSPSLGTQYSLASPSSYYFRISGYQVLYLRATIYYNRGTGSYSHAFVLQPW